MRYLELKVGKPFFNLIFILKSISLPLTFSNRFANLVSVALIAWRTNAVGPMVSGLTNGIDSALIVVHTRILALLRDTGQHARTVAVNRTLGLALGVRVALQARRTRAPADVSTWPSYGVDAARVGVARVSRHRLDRWRAAALDQCVSKETGQAGADRRVAANLAFCVATANAGTGVVAVEVAACHVVGTVGVYDTLRLALAIGITLVVGRAAALTVISNAAWYGANTTRIRLTRVSDDRLG